MKRHGHTPEQAVRKLHEGERMLNEGQDLTDVLKQLEIAESTWSRWRNQYGGMKADGAKKLKELEIENAMTMTAVEAHLEGKGWFSDGRVEPLAIIDIGELEIVEALMEHGVGTLPEHLGSWIASDLHRVSLRNHLYDKIDASRGDVFRSAALLEAWGELEQHFLSNLAPQVSSFAGRSVPPISDLTNPV